MIVADQIKETEAFKEVENAFQKQLLISKANREKINLGYNMSNTVGFDDWVNKYQPTEQMKKIVKELLN